MAEQKEQSSDLLLWLAAGVVALMGVTWLVVSSPWSSPEPDPVADLMPEAALPASSAAGTTTAPAEAQSAASDPLHMAQMALDAGMLVEPEAYSAWTLFGRVATADPDNEAAREGLEQVADALMTRANSAFEQGRYEDAGTISGTITTRFPEHAEALALAARIIAATAPPEPEATRSNRAAERAAPVDPVPEMNDAFRDAMARNAVLRPPGTSAIDIVSEMLEVAPEHELTLAAQELLVTEMLDRSVQSIEALDSQAAQTWIDSAESLGAEPERLAGARERLTRHLIETETQKILPASELVQLSAPAPEFPRVALERGIEGWVELEFIVSPDGQTGNITVIDASHERYFRDEAVAAVGQWQFEPVMFMGQPIPKRSYTRLAFVFE